jgi:hypothetical protein
VGLESAVDEREHERVSNKPEIGRDVGRGSTDDELDRVSVTDRDEKADQVERS